MGVGKSKRGNQTSHNFLFLTVSHWAEERRRGCVLNAYKKESHQKRNSLRWGVGYPFGYSALTFLFAHLPSFFIRLPLFSCSSVTQYFSPYVAFMSLGLSMLPSLRKRKAKGSCVFISPHSSFFCSILSFAGLSSKYYGIFINTT